MPMSQNMSYEEVKHYFCDNFINDVLYGITWDARLPDQEVATYAEGLGFAKAVVRLVEDLIWEGQNEGLNNQGKFAYRQGCYLFTLFRLDRHLG
jgi:hypothetical protein